MIKCCLCRKVMDSIPDFEPTHLPGSGWRCVDRHACAERIKSVVDAHKAFADTCDEVT